jgi:tetratricopeptide (TPR) repeat protein
LLERGKWNEAANLELVPTLGALPALANHKWAIGNVHFARAIGAAHSGNTAVARSEIAALAALEQSLVVPAGEYDWRKQIAIQRQIAEAWLARAEHRDADAERIMRAAADLDDATEKHPVTPGSILPAREQLGALLLELNRPADALKEYQASLTRAPRRLAGLYGAARAAQRVGQNDAARRYYAELLAITKGGNSALTEIREAQAFTAKYARP